MRKRSLVSILLLVAASGCGGNDPLNVFNKGDGPPAISLPLAGALTGFSQFLPSQKYFTFLTGTTSVTAPVDGFITAVDIEAPTGVALYSVTILYNTRYSVRVGKMSGTVRRVGDFVSVGAPIGSTDSTTQTLLELDEEGAPICPYSYFNIESRTRIHTRMTSVGGNILPCAE